tara:strand:+ start:2182 stop:5730 length:3549 start_codon:yes stop_codon:yes gene_type:complete
MQGNILKGINVVEINPFFKQDSGTTVNPFLAPKVNEDLPTLNIEDLISDTETSVPPVSMTGTDAAEEPQVYDDANQLVDEPDNIDVDEVDEIVAAITPEEIIDNAYSKYLLELYDTGKQEDIAVFAQNRINDLRNTDIYKKAQAGDPAAQQLIERIKSQQDPEQMLLDGRVPYTDSVEEMTEYERNRFEVKYKKDKEKTLNFLNSRNAVTSGLTEQLLFAVDQGYLSIPQLNFIIGADEWFNPVTVAVEVPHNFKDVQESVRKGELKAAAGHAAMGVLNTIAAIPLAKVAVKGINKGWEALSGGRGAYNEVQDAMVNETKRAVEIKRAAATTANENKTLRNRLILEFEEKFKVTISKEDAAGNLIVDPQLVRQTGKKKVTDYYIDDAFTGSDGKSLSLSDYAINDESLAIPILDPEKMDMFVATIVDLKKANPELAKKLDKAGGGALIDRLFDATLEGNLLGSEDLLAALTKRGLSFEEYVLGVVGSGSDAGKLLNQLSQMKRLKPSSVKEAQEAAAKIETQKAFGRLWAGSVLRMENIRRGLMVSSVATAARNFQSGMIRAPMESLADVMDTALLTYAKSKEAGDTTAKAIGKFASSVNPLVRDGTWSGSMNNLRYMFMDQTRAQQFTDYILDRPELADQFSRMYSSIQEIQKYTGKGQATTKLGKSVDEVTSRMEDFVWAVNTPNRWQEHLIRRATFLGELERQVKVNWDLDLQTALKQGKIQDMLNDAATVRPEGGTSFLGMIEQATNKALDVTYAKQPDFAPFKAMTNGITKSGLTVIIPFPRFMFNSMEYLAQNVGGSALPVIRRAISKDARGPLSARDRQDITRNLVGAATLMSVYQVRKQYGTNDYTVYANEEQQVDVSAQYPMRQMGWMTEAYDRYMDGTFETWYGTQVDEMAETWLGTNARTGTGNIFIEEVREMIAGSQDIVAEDKRAKALGRVFGQYANTFLTPLFQIPEAQRALGIRGTEAKDFTGSVNVSESAFVNAFYEQQAKRGMAAPSFEEELPQRVDVIKGPKERPDAASRLALGLTINERDSDVGDYLKEIGFADATYELGSKSTIPENKIAENEYISIYLPMMVEIAKEIASEQPTKKEEHLTARKIVKETAVALREEFNDPQLGDADQQAIVADQLRRLDADSRKYGVMRFKQQNDGRLPDIESLDDLIELLEYAKEDMGLF